MPLGIVEMSGLARNWRVAVVRGLIAIAFGLLALGVPSITPVTQVVLFAAFASLNGLLGMAMVIRRTDAATTSLPWVMPWGALWAEGAAGLAIGIGAFFCRNATAITLLNMVAAWVLVTGALQVAGAFRLCQAIQDEWLLAMSGMTSIGFGALLVLSQGRGSIALVLWLGAYAVLLGALQLGLGKRLHSWSTNRSRSSAIRVPARLVKPT
jgi:uncharacterized membrane protein HdeD (DUF308 family)